MLFILIFFLTTKTTLNFQTQTLNSYISGMYRGRHKVMASNLSLMRRRVPMIPRPFSIATRVLTVPIWLLIMKNPIRLPTMIHGFRWIKRVIVVVMIMRLIIIWKRVSFQLHMRQFKLSLSRHRHNLLSRAILSNMELWQRWRHRRPRLCQRWVFHTTTLRAFILGHSAHTFNFPSSLKSCQVVENQVEFNIVCSDWVVVENGISEKVSSLRV